jgi:ADP-ribosylglycohydrolase
VVYSNNNFEEGCLMAVNLGGGADKKGQFTARLQVLLLLNWISENWKNKLAGYGLSGPLQIS